MEMQTKLSRKNDMLEEFEPEIHVIRNKYLGPGNTMVLEETIRKVRLIPMAKYLKAIE